MSATPYHGPVVVLTTAEAKRAAEALQGQEDEAAKSIKRKVRAALGSSPKLKEPHD